MIIHNPAPGPFVLDINSTNAGRLVGFDINVTYNPLRLQVKSIDFYARQSVIYSSNNDNFYNTGEPVISGIKPPSLTAVISDAKIKFVGGTTWAAGNPVVYDINNDN